MVVVLSDNPDVWHRVDDGGESIMRVLVTGRWAEVLGVRFMVARVDSEAGGTVCAWAHHRGIDGWRGRPLFRASR